MGDPVTSYLEQYAEPDVTQLAGLTDHYDSVLVIPAHRETAGQIMRVCSRLNKQTSLLMIIVNNSGEANDPESHQLQTDLLRQQVHTKLADDVHLLKTQPVDCLLVDRYTAGRTINRRQGVGLARKLGCDIALHLINLGIVRQSWIHTTDADAELPPDYLRHSDPLAHPDNRSPAAYVSPFRHQSPEGLETATALYEIRLLYYPAALQWAGSGYAYPTVGSTISIDANSYAKVRGFPKRATGEDFYLLDKLRKIGDVVIARGEPITLSGRLSDRVPVGTGTAIAAISSLQDPARDYQYEHPDCFITLRACLERMREAAVNQPPSFRFEHPAAHDFAINSGLYDHYARKQRQSPRPPVMQKHLDDWFDGLKTRQLVHYLRDHAFGSVSAGELHHAPWVPGAPVDGSDTLEALRSRLYTALFAP